MLDELAERFQRHVFLLLLGHIEVAVHRLQALCPASTIMSNMKAEINATTYVLVIRLSFHVFV